MLSAWLHTIAAVIVFLLVRAISIPGVDSEALHALKQSGGAAQFWSGSSAAIAGGGILWLVIFRGLAALISREPFVVGSRIRRVACALYLLVSGLRGLALAIAFESIQSAYGMLIADPGWRFRAIVALTLAAGGAVEWAIADWISRRGVGRGPLVLFAVVVLLGGAAELAQFGQTAGRDGLPSAHSLISLAAGIPLALVLFALSRRGAIEWPMPVKRGLVLTSPVDLLIVPYVAGRLTAELIQRPVVLAAEAQGATPFAWLAQLDVMAALATAAGITVWLIGRPSRGISAGYFAAAVLAPLITIVPVAAAIATDRDASIARLIGRGKGFEGTERFEVVLTAEGGDGGRDAPIVVQRLHALGVKSKIVESALGRIHLQLTGSEKINEALRRVLRRGKLSIAPVAVDQSRLTPSAELSAKYPRLEVRQDFDGSSYYVARDRGDLDSLIAEARLGLPADRKIAVEDQREVFAAFLLEPEVLSERDVRSARIRSDHELGRPSIQLELTKDAGERFGEATARLIRRKLAIVLDGVIMNAPIVQSRIDGGRVSISLGEGTEGAEGVEETYADARALAAAFESRAMSREWSLASIAASTE